jgi:hypothetical protein
MRRHLNLGFARIQVVTSACVAWLPRPTSPEFACAISRAIADLSWWSILEQLIRSGDASHHAVRGEASDHQLRCVEPITVSTVFRFDSDAIKNKKATTKRFESRFNSFGIAGAVRVNQGCIHRCICAARVQNIEPRDSVLVGLT